MSVAFDDVVVGVVASAVPAADVASQRNLSMIQKSARAKDALRRHLSEINAKMLMLVSNHKEDCVEYELTAKDETLIEGLANGLANTFSAAGWIVNIREGHSTEPNGEWVNTHITIHLPNDTTADPLADENTFAIKNPDIKLLKVGSLITFHHVPESLLARNKVIIGRLYHVERLVEYGHMEDSPLIVAVSLGELDPNKPVPIDTVVRIDHLIDKETGCVMGVTLIKNPPS